MRKMLLTLLASIAGTFACSSSSNPAFDEDVGATELALADTRTVLGFESLADWSATSGTLAPSTVATQGSSSLALFRFSYAQVKSVPIAIGALAATVSLDLQIPMIQPNPYWYGLVQLILDAPSVGLNSRFISQKDLIELTPGRFGRVDFTVPPDVQRLLANGAADLSVSLVLNVPSGGGVYLLDNLVVGAPPPPPRVPLPHGMEYCDQTPCSETPPAVAKVCPIADPDCSTNYHTTIVMNVNGRPISGGFLYFPWTRDDTLVIQSGADAPGFPTTALSFHGPRVELDSYTAVDIPVSYYHVAPVWGGVTEINIEATSLANDQVDALFFRHASYDTGTAFPDLLASAAQATLDAQTVTGVSGVRPLSLFSPAELAFGDGHWWDGRVNVNYGNPPWIDHWGGIPTGLVTQALQEYTHEYTHALFEQISGWFPSDSQCLNEGLANAVAVLIGTAPPSKLGPLSSRIPSGSFDGDCRVATEVHDIGNCYLYHVYKAGLLTDTFVRNVFHPQRQYSANFCQPSIETTTTTGDFLIVLFTEAAGGADMTPVINSMQLRNSGSYAAAKAALGF